MKTSIVMSTRNKWAELTRTLESIYNQRPGIEFEVIVIDDGSDDYTPAILFEYNNNHPNFTYRRLQNPIYRNPSVARNVGYRLATGEVIIAQSDDVIHASDNAIFELTNQLIPGKFLIAQVWNYYVNRCKLGMLYTGLRQPRPFFFLGSLLRTDLYAVGGNDEEFVGPGYDDDWFANCLIHGLGMLPIYLDDIVVGHHQDHSRPADIGDAMWPSRRLYEAKCQQAAAGKIPWQASSGPWVIG